MIDAHSGLRERLRVGWLIPAADVAALMEGYDQAEATVASLQHQLLDLIERLKKAEADAEECPFDCDVCRS